MAVDFLVPLVSCLLCRYALEALAEFHLTGWTEDTGLKERQYTLLTCPGSGGAINMQLAGARTGESSMLLPSLACRL